MNRNIRIVFSIVTLMMIVFLGGCFHWSGVKIIDLETSEGKLFSSFSSHPFVLLVDNQKREYVTMDYTPDKCILTTIDFEGNQISKRQIDRFNHVYYLDTICALSPDRRYLAYLKYDNYLYLLDLEKGEKTKLIEKQLVSADMLVRGIKWISDSELLIFKKKYLSKPHSLFDDSSMTKFNVRGKSVIKRVELVYPEQLKISPSGKYLALLDGVSIYRDFKLFDLKTLELLEFRKNSGFEYIDDICWSPSEEYIGYVKKKSIIIRPRNSDNEKIIKVLPKDAICYHLEFLNENTLIFTYGTKTNPKDENILRSIDITTGKEGILLKGEILSGRIYVVDNGKKLIAEVGY